MQNSSPPSRYHYNEDCLAKFVVEHLKWPIKKIGSRWVGADYDSILEQGGLHDVDEANLLFAAAGRILIKSALQFAVNRGNTRVEESDLFGGENQYSRFALDSLIVEAGVQISNVEDFLLYFVGSSEIVTEQDISAMLIAAKIPEKDTETVIEWLARLTFIGFEVGPNRFEFLYDEQDTRKFSIMARKTADETTNGTRRFRIHPAFHAFLEIKSHPTAAPGQMNIDL